MNTINSKWIFVWLGKQWNKIMMTIHLSVDSPNNDSKEWMKKLYYDDKDFSWEKYENWKRGRKETKIISKHFLYSLVSCENVAEVAAYRLGIVESQMIGHDFFSNDISSMIFKQNRDNSCCWRSVMFAFSSI